MNPSYSIWLYSLLQILPPWSIEYYGAPDDTLAIGGGSNTLCQVNPQEAQVLDRTTRESGLADENATHEQVKTDYWNLGLDRHHFWGAPSRVAARC